LWQAAAAAAVVAVVVAEVVIVQQTLYQLLAALNMPSLLEPVELQDQLVVLAAMVVIRLLSELILT
jgi:hypothetical protein